MTEIPKWGRRHRIDPRNKKSSDPIFLNHGTEVILEKSSHDAQLSIQVIEVTSGFTRCQGDMYLYPAGVVHRVAPVTHGIRLTFVMALVDIEASGCSSHDAATGSTLVPGETP